LISNSEEIFFSKVKTPFPLLREETASYKVYLLNEKGQKRRKKVVLTLLLFLLDPPNFRALLCLEKKTRRKSTAG
jgi:hypothetical protein